MNSEERDKILVETRNDVKWLKEWTKNHSAIHNKYTYYFIATIVGLLIAFLN